MDYALTLIKIVVVLKPKNEDDIALSSTCLFCIFNIIYGFLISNFVDLGEECFYRIPTDPFVAVGVMLAISHISAKRLERQRALVPMVAEQLSNRINKVGYLILPSSTFP